MDAPEFYVGIDVASETLAVALTRGPGRPVDKPLAVANDPDGFAALAAWLAEHGAGPETALVCLESTGVYGEALCYGLHERGFRVVVEDAAKVRRAMPVAGAKTDALDAARIADYAARFVDELRPWAPSEAVVEQVRTLLTMREQLTRERTAKLNARRMLRRKAVQTPLALRITDDAVAYLKGRIAEIDREVRRLTSSHPTIGPAVALVTSVPGVGLLLASHLCVATGGFRWFLARSGRSRPRRGWGSVPWSTRVGRASGDGRGAGGTARRRSGSCSTSPRSGSSRSRARRTRRTSTGRRPRGRTGGWCSTTSATSCYE